MPKQDKPKKKPRGKPFQKGNVPKSPGRPPLPDDIKEALKLGKEELCRTVIEIRQMPATELRAYIKNAGVAKRAIANAYLKNNHNAIKIYEDRVFGRAVETVDTTVHSDGLKVDVVITPKEVKPE